MRLGFFTAKDMDPRVVGHHIAWKRRCAQWIFGTLWYAGCAAAGIALAYRVAQQLGWR